jgi:hypothetical protein
LDRSDNQCKPGLPIGTNAGVRPGELPEIGETSAIELLQRSSSQVGIFVILDTGGQISDWHVEPSPFLGNMIS